MARIMATCCFAMELALACLCVLADDAPNRINQEESRPAAERCVRFYPGFTGSMPGYFTAVGDLFFFTANDGIHGYELWRSDGTEAGTVMVKDLRPGMQLTGTVRNAATNAIISGAVVTVGSKTATTSSTGVYTIADVPAGAQTVVITAAGYSDWSGTATVTAGGTVTLNASLTALPGAVSGTVTKTGGAAVASATVSIAGKTATTASNGTYSITGITAGTYTMTVSATGYSNWSGSVVITAGGTTTQNVTLTGVNTFTGNEYSGLYVVSYGAIAASNLTANENGQGGAGYGAEFNNTYGDPTLPRNVTLTGTNTGPGGAGRAVRISGREEWTFGADGLIAGSKGRFDEAEYNRQVKEAAGGK